MTSQLSDFTSLFTAMNIALRGICTPDQVEHTLTSSFEAVVHGLEAKRAALFLVKYTQPSICLHALCQQGFSKQNVDAIQYGDKRVPDTALSQVWKTVANDSGARASMAAGMSEFVSIPAEASERDQKFLCVPVRDSVMDRIEAVVHLEWEQPADPAFDDTAVMWVNNYCLALSHVIGFLRDSEQKVPGEGIPVPRRKNAPELIGNSAHILTLRQELHESYIQAADVPEPDPILILGEKGTGKDLVARYIHAYSARHDRPFIAVNCAEITDELAAARFFGHRRGSFTGSLANEPGFFRAADHGVLFLDEIGELSLRAQATLLRVLENRTIVPVGETRESRVDLQVILATNRDPEKAVADGLIRADLFDRFGTQVIRLAPLRERPEDIPVLISHFLAYHEQRTQKKVLGFHPDVMRMMVGYSWPGNVRELARACSSLITHCKPGSNIDSAMLNRFLPQIAKKDWNPKAAHLLVGGDIAMRDALKMVGREMILSSLRQHNWNIRSARQSLGLPKTTFRRYVQEFGIDIQPRNERVSSKGMAFVD